MIARIPGGAVEDLDEGVLLCWIIAEEDPRDDGVPMLLGSIDQLEVPPFEERWPTPVAVIALGVEYEIGPDRVSSTARTLPESPQTKEDRHPV